MNHNKTDRDLLLSLHKAGVERDGRWLVRDIDLDLFRGEIVTLIGPNGSGKSTTAKMALGIIKPSAGTVARKANITIGYVPQKLHIDSSLPLNVSRLMRLTSKLEQHVLESCLAETGAHHLINANIANLSGGELQRVLLARVIARKPDILVLDEPLQGVDFQGEAELYGLIARLREKLNCAILLISHDLHIVMAATDRVLCLNGHICCSGSPHDVANNAIYGQVMGHLTGEQLALYQHHHNHEHHDHQHCNHVHNDKTPCDDIAFQAQQKPTKKSTIIKGKDHA